MKKNQTKEVCRDKLLYGLKFSKFKRFICVVVAFLLCSSIYSQNKLNMRLNGSSIKNVFDEIYKQTNKRVIYNDNKLPTTKKITADYEDVSIEELLEEVLKETNLSYQFVDDYILIVPQEEKTVLQQVRYVEITGKVMDKDKNPLPGVTILLKGTALGGASDAEGNFKFNIPYSENMILVFSFIGMESKEVLFKNDTPLQVILSEDVEEMDEIVVTGMFERRAESFTGSAVTVKRDELLRVGNQNLLRSLSNIDPSFRIMESIEFGSDPNRAPEVQLRGKGSFPNLEGTYSGNPNEPLFILDGFETTVEKVFDLDMNRVESVTILKDAAAKAIYGSKAGNGVVVIETIRPKMGEIRIYYSGSIDLEAPDLTGYNLMNAREKLDFEYERGKYTGRTDGATRQKFQAIYQENLQRVLRGVDTYWLSQPLRVGTTNKHSLQFEGGDATMRYRAGINYNTIKGVMKGSERNTLTINTTLSYSYKNVIFRNILEFTKNKGINSPYGSFSEYTALNPYYSPYDDEGNLVEVVGVFSGTYFYNPLYNATLNTKDETSYLSINDNFYIEWNISPELKVTGRFSYTIQKNESDKFFPPGHTNFVRETDLSKKGNYTKGYVESQSIQSDAGINFSKKLNKHFFFLNGTWNMSDYQSNSNSYFAQGFGNDTMDDISFALGYPEGSSPSGADSHKREIGIIGALNYSFDDRYLFDASYRTTGSSVFGSANKWGQFWSLGAGWNVHHEKFMKSIPVDQLRIRGSVGYTGTQNFEPYQARARYDYTDFPYDGKYGAQMKGLANERLKWQRVVDYNLGLDIGILKMIDLRAEYYESVTNDLLLDLSIPPSIGFTTHKENLGKVKNNGVDVALKITPWRDNKNNGWLAIHATALHNKNKVIKISNSFKSKNDSQNEEKDGGATGGNVDNILKYTRPSTLYYEGQSMTAIWGVKSAGIDPIKGDEIYYDINNNLTKVWSSSDQVIIGDTEPKLSGNIEINAGFKGFTFTLSCKYKFGGDVYNTTLIDKVENVDGHKNLDKRVYKTWREVGDLAAYKSIRINGYVVGSISTTKPTSRFVQKDNELYFSTVNVGYDFYKMKWIKKVGLERLKFTFYMNELLRLSTVKQERGLSYPFARNFSFSLNATF